MAKKTDEWRDEVVDVSKLMLDLENPRLPKYVKDSKDEKSIRHYLLEKENVARIARSISANGYHHSAISIVYKDKGGKYTVLDGNRRLAACQLLSDPTLLDDARARKEYQTLSEELSDNALSAIKVAVAPSRKAAEKEIWDIHVTPSAKPWEVLQKLRMYQNQIENSEYDVPGAAKEYGMTSGSFKKELKRLYLYERILEHADNDEQDELLKSGFNKIQRVMQSKNGMKLLDFTIDDKGKTTITDSKVFNKNLKKMVPYITDPSKVHAQATQEDLIRDVYSKIDPTLFPPPEPDPDPDDPKGGGQPSGGKTGTSPKPPSSLGKKGTGSKNDWVTTADYTQYTGSDRVKNILEELKNNPPEKRKNLNLVALSLRVAIELAVYKTLEDKGHIKRIVDKRKAEIKAENAKRAKKGKAMVANLPKNWTPDFSPMLDYMLDESNMVIADPQERRALELLKKKKTDYMADLNSYVHNHAYRPTEKEVRDIWDSFGRPMFDMIEKINQQK